MWWLILLALLGPAAAQRPRCDFGEGVTALRQAQQRLALPVTGLVAGRESAQAVADGLETARAAFTRCGCPRLAELLAETARNAEAAVSHASVGRILTTFQHTAFQADLARQALERNGCR